VQSFEYRTERSLPRTSRYIEELTTHKPEVVEAKAGDLERAVTGRWVGRRFLLRCNTSRTVLTRISPSATQHATRATRPQPSLSRKPSLGRIVFSTPTTCLGKEGALGQAFLSSCFTVTIVVSRYLLWLECCQKCLASFHSLPFDCKDDNIMLEPRIDTSNVSYSRNQPLIMRPLVPL
jgi:hypothetical protein